MPIALVHALIWIAVERNCDPFRIHDLMSHDCAELSIDPSLARHLVPHWAVEPVERASGVDVRLGPFDPISNPAGWIPDDVGKLKAKAARID